VWTAVQWIPSPTNRAPSTAAMAARPPGCHAAVPGHQEETSSASCSVWAWARWRCRLVLAPTVYQAISAEAWLPSPSPLTLGTCHPDAGHGKLHSLLSCACPAPPDFDSRNRFAAGTKASSRSLSWSCCAHVQLC
jgi:hypothetical protein